ncbi:2-oxoglutarate dehydrogenase complex dihydrolipoyllysine-residue succinyltransferase [Lysinibacillus fusiformis]|uniref:Dihydrolipoyllysine-residue succinyltransferase component of 2-oxoglutarate dehydrogenase complex n=1 Tax=Lysinibacillus fusiformis TaxID=28031 RepID=A0A1E4R737_9BACI|nr:MULTISPECIES: 2-oxoglutarate dehydrogenase complex dihydrolipoyllysine-residue succinyltransferase [Lysinibacillus]AJK87937.1 dihydrolipoamide succinyltransferase [Lysinibacillus fusiformis]KAB0442947.1 dihydrolipoyllysine-residue succinyltransferase [Lysinibacillus fusiformis]KEK13372.1 dihydrolipoamide succinyltransferase [Lysinibacillus sphaericus]KHK50837.1 dihydrolipoamide succinyltransferase [Lysinibacillus sp. A1]MCE4042598.1 2-oxoglutarate dehydrogenase complex dihydrolipoyllysine-r
MAEIKVPELAESITEGSIAQWVKKVGDRVEKGEFIVELETDKVNAEIISEEAGVLTQILAEEGDTVLVGQVIAIVEAGEGAAAAPAAAAPAEAAPAPAAPQAAPTAPVAAAPVVEETSGERVIASPAARRLAREKGIDLAAVSPVDPQGRVRVQDVSAHGTAPAVAAPTPVATTGGPVVFTPAANSDRVTIEKMSRRRQTIAKRLLEVKQSTAMLTTFNEIDMTNIMALRKRKQEEFVKANDIKLGFMSFFTKAVVAALKKYPYVNAQIVGDELHLNNFFDIGIAVSTEEGLVVPVVRDANSKNFAEIEKDIASLATKAREKKLGLNDMAGGSFTITNGGVFGSLMSTPIMNGTQAGILGMHSIVNRPVAVNGEVQIRPMMYVALSYDHRIIDGKDSVGFLKTVKELIENPEDLLLNS